MDAISVCWGGMLQAISVGCRTIRPRRWGWYITFIIGPSRTKPFEDQSYVMPMLCSIVLCLSEIDENYWGELVKERSWIDPDFQERSLTKRLVIARVLSFLGSKNFDPSSSSDVTRVVCDFVRCFVYFKAFVIALLTFAR